MTARPTVPSTARQVPVELSDPPKVVSSTMGSAADYSTVILLADLLNDLEELRIANSNRLQSLQREWSVKGQVGDPTGIVEGTVDQLQAVEYGVVLALKRAVRESPLADFCADTKGLGEKTLGRLIGAIGDPAWNETDDKPRTVRGLYRYCGLDVWPQGPDVGGDAQAMADSQTTLGVAPHKIRGERAKWSHEGRKRLYLVAESMVKNRDSAYRDVYDAGREKYADAVHTIECRRCGPSGKPAPVGSPLSDGHKHARALRLVMKAFLKDLWRAASLKSLNSSPGQPTGTHTSGGATQ